MARTREAIEEEKISLQLVVQGDIKSLMKAYHNEWECLVGELSNNEPHSDPTLWKHDKEIPTAEEIGRRMSVKWNFTLPKDSREAREYQAALDKRFNEAYRVDCKEPAEGESCAG